MVNSVNNSIATTSNSAVTYLETPEQSQNRCYFWPRLFWKALPRSLQDRTVRMLDRKLTGTLIPITAKQRTPEEEDGLINACIDFNSDCLRRHAVETADGYSLDCLEVIPETVKDPKKWVVFYQGNFCAWQTWIPKFVSLANRLGVKILVPNYRGSFGEAKPPSSPEQLMSDGKAAIHYLAEKEEIPIENITTMGFSLGGSIAIHTAHAFREHNMGCTVINTFNSLSDVTYHFPKARAAYVAKTIEESRENQITNTHPISCKARLCRPLTIFGIEILDFIARIAYFSFSFVSNLLHGRIFAATKDVGFLLKTAVCNTLLVAGSVLGLIAIPLFGRCAIALHYRLRKLTSPAEESTAVLLVKTPFIQWLLPRYAALSNWDIRSGDHWNEITGKKLAFYAPGDTLIPPQASIIASIHSEEEKYRLKEDEDHIPHFLDKQYERRCREHRQAFVKLVRTTNEALKLDP